MYLTQLHDNVQMQVKNKTINDCRNMQTVVQNTNSELQDFTASTQTFELREVAML
jgi:hypothetical protein